MVVDACLPKGFNETFVSPEDGREYLIVPADDGADFDACDKQVCAMFCFVPHLVCERLCMVYIRPFDFRASTCSRCACISCVIVRKKDWFFVDGNDLFCIRPTLPPAIHPG